MLQKVQYIDYLRKFSKRLNSIVEKIEKNKNELTDQDREIIDATLESFLKTDKEF